MKNKHLVFQKREFCDNDKLDRTLYATVVTMHKHLPYYQLQ